jgi:predicted unusual protein kinase regulating ubiquinone biosynthesis (AarF/ABC1/UbiB family)
MKTKLSESIDLSEIETLLSHFAEHADWILEMTKKENISSMELGFSLGRLHSTIRESHFRAEHQIYLIHKYLSLKDNI